MKRAWLALAIWIATAGHATEIIPDKCALCVKTPSLSARQTRKLRLDNGLEAYLISDPGAPESAAAIAVDVGSWQNPPGRHGLAHFCEHLLFLGNAAYPTEGGFRRFLEERGGKTNAYTTDTHTAYMFSVQDGALDGALARLAHFFIEPRFDQDAMARELKAVDEEFQRTIENDDRRQLMVLKTIAHPEHPFSRFAAGNARTLGSTTSSEIRAWFDAHYSANLMHLVVLSSRPLDELQEVVENEFAAIPNYDYPAWTVTGSQLSSSATDQIVYVTPHQKRQELTLLWELPYDYTTDTQVHAADLVSFVLGHEGEGSLVDALRQNGLAETLSCGVWRHRKPHTESYFFILNVGLTDEGVDCHMDVAAACFSAISRLSEIGIPNYIHEEMISSRRLRYEYQTRRAPFDAVSDLVDGLLQEDLTTFPQATLVPSRYDPMAIQTVLEGLQPDSAQLMVTAPTSQTGVRAQQKEQWLGAQYAAIEIPIEQRLEWLAAKPDPALSLPAPNPFMPDNPQVIYQDEPKADIPFPNLINNTNYLTLYLATDEHYQVPEIAWRFRIKSAAITPMDAHDAAITDLMVYSINQRLNTVSYPAHIAGLHFRLTPRSDGIALAVDGVYQKALTLFEHILEGFTDGIPTVEEFERYKAALQKQYDNTSKAEPVRQALTTMKEVLHLEEVSDAAKARALRHLDYQSLVLFFETFREKTFAEGMLFGNMTREDGEKVGDLIRHHFQREPFPPGEQPQPAVISLPQQKGPFYLTHKVKSQGNGVVLAVEEGPFSFKNRAAQQILATGLEAPFFEELRTRQQTGYIVQSWAQDIDGHLFQFFAVQSNRYDGQELLARFELFIEHFLRQLKDETFTNQRFETVQRALIHKLRQLPKNPSEMGDLLATIAFDHHADFDWINERIRGLQSLTYDEFLNLSTAFLGRANKQRLAILAQGRTGDEPLQYHRVRSVDRIKQIGNYSSK